MRLHLKVFCLIFGVFRTPGVLYIAPDFKCLELLVHVLVPEVLGLFVDSVFIIPNLKKGGDVEGKTPPTPCRTDRSSLCDLTLPLMPLHP